MHWGRLFDFKFLCLLELCGCKSRNISERSEHANPVLKASLKLLDASRVIERIVISFYKLYLQYKLCSVFLSFTFFAVEVSSSHLVSSFKWPYLHYFSKNRAMLHCQCHSQKTTKPSRAYNLQHQNYPVHASFFFFFNLHCQFIWCLLSLIFKNMETSHFIMCSH